MIEPAAGPTAVPRRRRGKGLPPEEMARRFPSLPALAKPPAEASKSAWVAVFTARPDAMHALLADFIKQVYAQPGRIGQRPMPKEEEVDFTTLLYGEDNDLPLVQVLPKLIKVSERAFVTRIHMSRTQFQRLLRGEYHPDVNEIRTIAIAVKKPPTYFVEYRMAMVVAAFINLITDRPGIGTALYKQYLDVRLGET